MISITLSSEISEACPDLHVLAIACQVKNTEPDERLWEEITRVEEDIRSTCKIEDINKWTPIFATRQAYKRLGKDPNRYRDRKSTRLNSSHRSQSRMPSSA